MAFRGNGCGYAAMQEWCSIMNMPSNPSQDTYTKLHHKVSEASTKAFKEISKQSKEEICRAYQEVGAVLDEQGVLDIGVSYEGSCQKRGYSFHNGMGSVIDLLTGLPIDYEVFSNFCSKCKIAAEQPPDPEWEEKHKEKYVKNLEGTAGAIKVEAAVCL